jgi:transposase
VTQKREHALAARADISDAVLGERLFANSGTKQCHRRHAEPDWSEIHRELRRNHVTLSILWDEYIERHPTGYRYSRFCDLYREWTAPAGDDVADARCLLA